LQPNKIDAAGLVKVAIFARKGILYLGDRIEPLTFQGQVVGEMKKNLTTSGERKASTGSVPNFTFSGEGVRIADLSSDSPAEKRGYKKGISLFNLVSIKLPTWAIISTH
jgi:aminopeptidase N